MTLPTPPYPTSSVEFEQTRSGHNAKYTPADYIPKEALRDLLVRSAPDEQRRNMDLETTLAHERLTQMPMYDDLGMLYGELYTASPIPPFQVTQAEYLSHLFAPGESVIVTDAFDNCSLWEREHSPDVSPFKSGFFPFAIDPAKIQKAIDAGRRPQPMSLSSLFKYVAFSFAEDDVHQLFPQIARGEWPVASVMSSGPFETEILFRVDARTQRALKEECQRLGDRIVQFVSAPTIKFNFPAGLPAPRQKQRLIYLAPG